MMMEKGADRLEREAVFHNRWACNTKPRDVLVEVAFEACTAPENRFIRSLLSGLEGRRLLDLGCGLGEAAVFFAKQGAVVTACDLSAGMLDMAAQVAALHGVTIATHQAPAERTALPADSFDIVYAGNVLHHVNLPRALDEIYRVLKPGGIFVSWDPLAHNPFINIYRRLARAVRTTDEHPLTMKELTLFQQRFCHVQWRCFWLMTLMVFLRFLLWERVSPSAERYWKKILFEAERLTPFYNRLERIDRWLLARMPWLQRYCWNVVVWGSKGERL